MASHVLGNVAANTFFDTTDQSFSFKTSFTGATADTQTTLSFVQQANQTVTFPDLSTTVSKADTLLVSGSSGFAQSVSNLTISTSTISSLSSALTVPNGGTGLTTAPVSSIITGNGTSALNPVTLTANQFLMGTAGAPTSGTITGSTGAKVTVATGSATISAYAVPVRSRTTLTTAYANTASATDFFATGSGSPAAVLIGNSTIPANTLAAGDVIYINISGGITVSSSTTMNLVLSLGGVGTPLHSPSITMSTIANYILNIKGWIVCGSAGSTYGQLQVIAWTGANTFTGAAYVAPVIRTLTYSNALTLVLSYTTSAGTMSYVPALTNVYIVKGS